MLDTLLKHAKHFTDTSKSGPAQVIHFYSDGSLFMSDSIIAVLASNIHTDGDHTRTSANQKCNGQLLQHSRMNALIGYADEVESTSFINCNIDVDELLAFTDGVNTASKFDGESTNKDLALIQIDMDEVDGLVCSHRGVDFRAYYKDDSEKVESKKGAIVNGHKLTTVLKLFKQLGYEDVKLLIRDTFRPIEIRSYDAKIRSIILPIKK